MCTSVIGFPSQEVSLELPFQAIHGNNLKAKLIQIAFEGNCLLPKGFNVVLVLHDLTECWLTKDAIRRAIWTSLGMASVR